MNRVHELNNHILVPEAVTRMVSKAQGATGWPGMRFQGCEPLVQDVRVRVSRASSWAGLTGGMDSRVF